MLFTKCDSHAERQSFNEHVIEENCNKSRDDVNGWHVKHDGGFGITCLKIVHGDDKTENQ